MKHFKYHQTATLLKYVGDEVEWLDLSDSVRKGIIEGNEKRTWLPEACNPYADTVMVRLPLSKKKFI